MKKKYLIIYILTAFYGCFLLEKEITLADISKSQSFNLETVIKNPNTLQLEIKGEVDSNIQFNHYWLPDGVIRRDTTTGNGNDRDVFNAFQHSFWNANLTTRMGSERAKVWADAHESGLPNNSDNNWATQMDFFNNHVGREIGQLWRDNQQGFGITLAQLVENWLNNGQMRYICFGGFDNIPGRDGSRYLNQRFVFSNQNC